MCHELYFRQIRSGRNTIKPCPTPPPPKKKTAMTRATQTPTVKTQHKHYPTHAKPSPRRTACVGRREITTPPSRSRHCSAADQYAKILRAGGHVQPHSRADQSYPTESGVAHATGNRRYFK